MELSLSVPTWATHIVSDLSDWDRRPQPVEEAAPTGVWSFSLPDDAYFEYCFLDGAQQQRSDPTNDRRAENPWYPAARMLTGPDYTPSPYATPTASTEASVRRWRLESQLLKQTRRLLAYVPVGYEDQALPTVYVQDGVAYYRVGRLHLVLEQLLAERHIRPANIVFIEPIERSVEYPYNDSYQRFVREEVMPYVEQELHCTEERIAMGASLGGLVSGLLAWQHPDHFQTVITQSGAFIGAPEDKNWYDSAQIWLLDQVRQQPKKMLRWYCETGTLEWLHGPNKQLGKALDARGYDCCYAERSAGHNWVNWRNGLADALTFALAV